MKQIAPQKASVLRCRAAAAVACLAIASASMDASAALCQLSAPGKECIINWDVSNLGTGPFDYLGYGGSWSSGLNQLDAFWYEGLNASGPVRFEALGANVGDVFDQAIKSAYASSWDDGMASVRLKLIAGSGSVFSLNLDFADSNRLWIYSVGTSGIPAALPTPATAPLLIAAGFAAFVARRRSH